MPAPWSRGVRVVIKGLIHGQEYNNVLHFATNVVVLDGTELEDLLRQLCDAVQECITSTLFPATTSDFTFTGVEAAAIAPDVSDPVTANAPVTGAGTLGAQGIGFGATLVQLRTGLGGRKGRGRIYLPPGPEANATAGEWDPAFLALVAAFCACMAGKFIGSGASTPWRIGVLSRKDMGTPPSASNFNTAFREVISFVPQAVIAKMGSRQKGKGS